MTILKTLKRANRLKKAEKIPKVNLENCFKYVPEIKKLLDGDDQNISSMLHYASELEGTNRQIGIHACGIIIGADDLTKVAPVCTIKDKATDSELLVTQYDGRAIESVGLIKMDFRIEYAFHHQRDAGEYQTIERY